MHLLYKIQHDPQENQFEASWERIKITYIRHIFIFLDVINKLYVV
jgi:hypothetical protein